MLRYSSDSLEDKFIKFFLGRLALVPVARRVAHICAFILLAAAVAALVLGLGVWALQYSYPSGVMEECYGPLLITQQRTAHGTYVYNITEDELFARVRLTTRTVNASFGIQNLGVCYHGPYGKADDEFWWRARYTPEQLQEANLTVFLQCPMQHSYNDTCELKTSTLQHYAWFSWYFFGILNIIAFVFVPAIALLCVIILLRVLFIFIERQKRKNAELADDGDNSV
jgi:hypothetical protein